MPEARIRARYARVMEKILPRVLPLTDRTYVFDNSSVEAGLDLVAVYANGAFTLRLAARTSHLRGWLTGLMRPAD